MTEPIPKGYHTVTPYLVVRGTAEAIDFYGRAFGAVEAMRLESPDGAAVMHAEIRIGDSPVMMTEENLGMGTRSPRSLGGTPVTVHLFVEDVDAVFAQAVASGATPVMAPEDMFWGDRFARIADPFGHSWSIATHVRDVGPEEMREAMQAVTVGEQGCDD